MAIVASKNASKLKIVLYAGVDENNKDIIKNKTFNNVKPIATDESIYNTAVALSGLQAYALTNVKRLDDYDLSDE